MDDMILGDKRCEIQSLTCEIHLCRPAILIKLGCFSDTTSYRTDLQRMKRKGKKTRDFHFQTENKREKSSNNT